MRPVAVALWRHVFVFALVAATSTAFAEDPTPSDTPTPEPTSTPIEGPTATPTEVPTEAPPVATVTPTPVPDPMDRISCTVVPDTAPNNLAGLITSSGAAESYLRTQFDQLYIGFGAPGIYKATRYQNRVVLRAFCGKQEDGSGKLSVRTAWVIGGGYDAACTPDTSSLCTEFMAPLNTPDNNSIPPNSAAPNSNRQYLMGAFVLHNPSPTDITVQGTEVKFKVTGTRRVNGVDVDSTREYGFNGAVEIQGVPPMACQISISGTLNPQGAISVSCGKSGDCDAPESTVQNRSLVAKATLMSNVAGSIEPATPPVFTSSPAGISSNGEWANPPSGVSAKITATVKPKNGEAVKCVVRIQPIGERFSVDIKKAGDCGLFQGIRDYYYRSLDNTKVQTAAYEEPIKFYGRDDVRFKMPRSPIGGAMNGDADTVGLLNVGLGGVVERPPMANAPFSGTVLGVYAYSGGVKNVDLKKPIAAGYLNLSDFTAGQLTPFMKLGTPEEPKENDLVTFVAWNAAIISGNKQHTIDVRGQGSNPPWWEMSLGDDNGEPRDIVVPFVQDTCVPGLKMTPPARKKKAMSKALKSASMCVFSRPYRYGDFKSGRISLKMLYMAPMHPTAKFPVDLMRASRQRPCAGTGAMKKCWIIDPRDMPPKMTRDNFYPDYRSCFQIYWTGSAWGYIFHEADCPVLGGDECDRELQYRIAAGTMMQGAAALCSEYFDGHPSLGGASTSGMPVSPVPLMDHPWEYYGKSLWYNQTKKGFGCVACRFAPDAAKGGRVLGSDYYGYVYAMTKSEAPADCVQEVEYTIRHWGSDGGCDKGQTDLQHGCLAGNVASCPGRSESFGSRPPITSGTNVFARGTVPLCPGSHMEFERISVSWSPIVVDVRGRGIRISRSIERAVPFDIRGDGQKVLVDWPENNDGTPFLVRPKDGKVESIRQLFGDDSSKNGFESLSKYDSNRDQLVDRRDKRFNELALWFDRNRNGIAEADEIEALAGYGVDVIYLRYAPSPLDKTIEKKTLSSVYFNEKTHTFFNLADVWFNEYWKGGKRLTSFDPKESREPKEPKERGAR